MKCVSGEQSLTEKEISCCLLGISLLCFFDVRTAQSCYYRAFISPRYFPFDVYLTESADAVSSRL